MEALNRLSGDEFRSAAKIPVIAVLENVRSAYNVGAVFRTADAFLLEGIRLTGYTAFPPHKEIRKTALGAEDTVAWKHFRLMEDCIADLKADGYRVFAVEQVSTSVLLQQTSFSADEKVAVVFGNEVSGVEENTLKLCEGFIEIPQAGTKHSLNIATAAGIVLWELVRNRIKTDGNC